MADREEKHLFVSSPIDMPKWEAARWLGVAYLGCDGPPGMCLIFDDESAGRSIFEGWIKDFGYSDKEDYIRIAIVEGDAPGWQNPGYFVHIGPDANRVTEHARAAGIQDESLAAMLVSRIHRMNPKSDVSVKDFRNSFEERGAYFLMPAVLRGGELSLFEELGIEKRTVIFRNFGEVSENDEDAILLKPPSTSQQAN